MKRSVFHVVSGGGLVLAFVAVGCLRVEQAPRVICHNANCVEPANPDEDDTVAALDASLALRQDGRPIIDGVEIDTFWYGAEERCLFAHDLASLETASDVDVAVERLSASIDERSDAGEPLTSNGDPFFVFIELKGTVGPDKADVHNDEQRAQHAACAVAAADAVAVAAVRANQSLRVVLTSFTPELLAAVSDARDARGDDPVPMEMMALFGIPPPLDGQTLPLSAFDDVNISGASVHPQWMRETSWQAYRSQGFLIGYWMFSAVPETLAAIERDQPDFITTSEATFMRRWLKR